MDSTMVNAPVKAQKRQSRRLSKPRTNSSSANAVRPRVSLGEFENVTRSAADLLSPGASRGPADTAIYDDGKLSQEEKDPRNDSVDSSHEQSAKGGVLQRTGTKIVSRLSHRPNLGKSSSSLALNRTVEPAEDYEWLKEKAQKDRQAMRDHRPSGASEDASDGLAPYRRKSLLTPGLATRGGDVLRKPHATTHRRSRTDLEYQERYYNQRLSPISPLARIASLDVPGRRNPDNANRAATPSSMDYGRIGGSLRIANGGAVSPSQSFATPITERPSPLAHVEMAGVADNPSRGSVSTEETSESPSDEFTDADESVQIVDPDIYDPYAEDAGNPWADEAHVTSEITAAIAQASEPAQKPLPERAPSPSEISAESPDEGEDGEEYHNDDNGDDDESDEIDEIESPGLLDYFGYSSAEAHHHIEKQRSQPPSPAKEESPSSGSRKGLPPKGETVLFAEEPPIPQPPRLGPPTPHRPSDGELDLRDSRLEMARVLDNMMAASRFTPVQRREEEDYWSNGPSSATSTRPSHSFFWDGDVTGSNTSLTSAEKSASPNGSFTRGKRSPGYSRTPPELLSQDVFSEMEQSPHLSKPLPLRHPNIEQTVSDHAKHLPPLPDSVPRDERSSRLMVYTTDLTPPEESASEAPSSPSKTKPKTVTKKLQKRQPRPKSMPPVPVERIVVAGQRGDDDMGSPIPEVPEDMRARVAERWNSRPTEDREPTIPFLGGDSHGDYFAQSPQTGNQDSFQLSPNAPPVPERSAARPRMDVYYDSGMPANEEHAARPHPRHRRRGSRSELIHSLQHPPRDRSVPPTPSLPDSEDFIPHNVDLHAQRYGAVKSVAAASSVYSQSQYQANPASRPMTAYSRPGTAYATTDDEETPIDWAQIRRVWAARRQDAGDSLRMRMERAREEIETGGSMFPDVRASWAPGAQEKAALSRTLSGAASTQRNRDGQQEAFMDGNQALRPQFPTIRDACDTSPLSQPSAVPSPLRQATYPTSGPVEVNSPSSRHKRNVRSEPHATYFPTTPSVSSAGYGFEADIDSDMERERGNRAKAWADRNRHSTVAAGRYDGGLAFGFERGKGVGGSAGTRSAAGHGASRKAGAGNLAEGFGVDLSDVPIFVTKAGVR